jgi:hypothetical protein
MYDSYLQYHLQLKKSELQLYLQLNCTTYDANLMVYNSTEL